MRESVIDRIRGGTAKGWKPLRAVVYVRQASWDYPGSKTVEHQLKAGLRWCEENRVTVVGTVLDDRSASRFARVERSGLTVALDMVTALRATVLWTPHFDHFGRNVAEFARVRRVWHRPRRVWSNAIRYGTRSPKWPLRLNVAVVRADRGRDGVDSTS